MYDSKPYFYGTGRRKHSVARVRVYANGTGSIKINGRDIDDYFGLETLKLIVRQPMELTDTIAVLILSAMLPAAVFLVRLVLSVTVCPERFCRLTKRLTVLF